MTSRLESAAATRRALLDSAAELLDGGGPGAVTLREVGGTCRRQPRCALPAFRRQGEPADRRRRRGLGARRRSHARAADRLATSTRREAARGAHRLRHHQPQAAPPLSIDVQRTGGGPGRRGQGRAARLRRVPGHRRTGRRRTERPALRGRPADGRARCGGSWIEWPAAHRQMGHHRRGTHRHTRRDGRPARRRG